MAFKIKIVTLEFLVLFPVIVLSFINPYKMLPQANTRARQITQNPGDEIEPQWSPDGQYIAFHSHRRGNSDIWLIRRSDREPIQLTDSKAHDSYPDWSPDSRNIVFDSRRSGNSDIWIISIEERVLIQETFDLVNDVRPSWSNEGSKVAFSSSRSGNMDIWIKDKSDFWNESKK